MIAITRRLAWILAGALLAGNASAATLQISVVDEAGKPLADTAVFLDSPQAKRAIKPLPGASVGQKDRTFIPSLLIIPTGTSVHFPNMDTVRHHVYSFSPAKRFELKLYVGTPAEPVVFDQSGIVLLGCNIHDQMVGTILVVDTPFYGITSADGRLTLHNVPAGPYTLRAWHSRLPNGTTVHAQPITLNTEQADTKVVLKKLRRQ